MKKYKPSLKELEDNYWNSWKSTLEAIETDPLLYYCVTEVLRENPHFRELWEKQNQHYNEWRFRNG